MRAIGKEAIGSEPILRKARIGRNMCSRAHIHGGTCPQLHTPVAPPTSSKAERRTYERPAAFHANAIMMVGGLFGC